MILSLRSDAARIPLADGSVHAVVTSPPYMGLRAYFGVAPTVWPDGWTGCLGNEPTVDLYVAHTVECFREVKRVLRDDGTLWLVIGDSYGRGKRPAWKGDADRGANRRKAWVGYAEGAAHDESQDGQLLGVPWLVAFALQRDGWLLRSDICWSKTSVMPESVRGWSWSRCRVKVREGGALDGGKAHRRDPARGDIAASLHVNVPTEWADCPGCDKCAPNDGLVLRRGSWRPTRAHEFIFMLAKQPSYFCDAEAVAEPAVSSHGSGNGYKREPRESFADADGPRGSNETWVPSPGATRNPRDVWTLGPEPTGSVVRKRRVLVPPREADDGMIRTASPDCPVHSLLGESGREQTDGCDELPGLGSPRTSGNDGRPAHVPCGEDAAMPHGCLASSESSSLSHRLHGTPTSTTSGSEGAGGQQNRVGTGRTGEPPDDTPGCLDHEDARTASGRSSEIHKMDLAPETTPACKPYDENPFRTRRNAASPASSGSADRTRESNSARDDSAGRPSAQSSDRSEGSLSRCRCSYHREEVDSVAHYAAFPSEIPRRCILAGTSARGVCATCGAPWARVLDRQRTLDGIPTSVPAMRSPDGQDSAQGVGHWRTASVSRTLGWRATCEHSGEPVPATVLDPFAGSGTTGRVAIELGRRAVLCDASQTYLRDIADKRTRNVQVELLR